MRPTGEDRTESPFTGPPQLSPGAGPASGEILPRNQPLSPAIRSDKGALPLAPSSTPNALGLLKALRRRWRLSLIAGLSLAGTVAFAVWNFVPPAQYSTHALLRVSSIPPTIIFNTRENRPPFEVYLRSQMALIKSRIVLNTALKQPGVANLDVVKKQLYPVEWLENAIQVDYPGGAEILRIAMNGDNPKEVAVLVNAVKDAYLEEIVNVEMSERRARFDQLEEIYGNYQRSLQDKRTMIRRLSEQVGSGDKTVNAYAHQFNLDTLHVAEKELLRMQFELKRARVEARHQAAPAVPEGEVEAVIRQDPHYEAISNNIARLDVNISNLAKYLSRTAKQGENDPSLGMLKEQAAKMRAALAARRRELAPIVVEQLRQKAQDQYRSSGTMPEKRIEILDEMERLLTEDVKRLREGVKKLNTDTLDLQEHQDGMALADSAAKRVGEELELLKVELQAPPRIKLLEEAEEPRTKGDNGKAKKSAMAGFGVFGMVLLGISFWEFRARRIDSVDEVVNDLGLRLMGALPALPDRLSRRSLPQARTGIESRWSNLLVEHVDAVRTMLLHATGAESHRIVMVTSALGGEGKTTLAVHLATSLARSGRRTLLIDCDLRRPSAARLFDLQEGPGLCEVLRGECEVDDVIQPSPAADLSILVAGQCDSRSLRALATIAPREIFRHLSEDYDFIVVDSSPVLPVADTLLVAQHVDAVLFSILRDVSRVPKVYAAYERLASLGVRMLGAVVSGARIESYGYGYEYVFSEPR